MIVMIIMCSWLEKRGGIGGGMVVKGGGVYDEDQVMLEAKKG
jgi:hypothetical protein